MDFANEKFLELAFSLAGSSILALIGFVWKISHRVSALEKMLESHRQLHSRDLIEVRRDIDVIYNNVDKNREWTTNRMMSIAKEMNQ